MRSASYTPDTGYLLDKIGFIILSFCSLGYLLHARRFAEWHIQFSFLDFPVFIGEIALFLCFLIASIKWYLYRRPWNKWHVILLFYILFIAGKAFAGYQIWGALALRDSAMAYYPLCALFGYIFYRKDFFNGKVILFLAGAALIILQFFWIYEYFLFAAVILTFLLMRAYPQGTARWLLWILFFLVIPYAEFFKGSRTMIIAFIGSVLLCLTSLFYIIPLKARYKFLISIFLGFFIFWGMKTQFDPNKLETLVNIRSFWKTLEMQEEELAFRRETFVPVQKNVKELRLYNPEGMSDPGNYSLSYSEYPHAQKIDWPKEVDNELGNMVFRVHIWKDIRDQLVASKPFLGFDFGKPLRSSRLEMLGLAVEVWNRDGWLGAHNSFLYLIYRMGILGLLGIFFILGGFVYLMKLSIEKRSVAGILLCGVILYGLIAANFLLIFELPYNAIPLWFLVGITIAYLTRERNLIV